MDKKLTGLVIVFILVLGVFVSTLFFNSSGKASQIRAANTVPSCDDSHSLVFAERVSASVGSAIPFIVHIRSDKNEGVANVSVTCQTTLGTIDQTPMTTEKTGNATFSLQSQVAGIATIICSIPQCTLPRGVSIEFTNP